MVEQHPTPEELSNKLCGLSITSGELSDNPKKNALFQQSNTVTNNDVVPDDSQNKNLQGLVLCLTRTGLVYDEAMTKHRNVWDKTHIEKPERIRQIYLKLVEENLIERCVKIPSRFATKDELVLCHTARHINEMESLSDKTLRELFARGEDFDSIYLSNHVYECATLSAGCTLEVLDHVMTGKVQNGVAVVRPPGHHALSDCPMGFCYFNNVALAAQVAITKYHLNKILIVDWDIHYGNGIHMLFENDPRVLYFSIHRYDNNNFWPCLRTGNYDQVGKGPGEGFTVMVPWNKKGMGNGDYLAAFNLLLMPIAYEFSPDLVLVSCGFDSGLGDPRGLCKVSPEGFFQLTNMLKGLANGKMILVLEGGYNLSTIANSMAACIHGLLGDSFEPPTSCSAQGSALESIFSAARVHSKYWKSLSWAKMLPPTAQMRQEAVPEEEKRLNEKQGDDSILYDPDLIQQPPTPPDILLS